MIAPEGNSLTILGSATAGSDLDKLIKKMPKR